MAFTMTTRKPFCIVFAGVVGSSKTPLSHYLSCKLSLPIFSNDALRSEVAEDIGNIDSGAYQKRRDGRIRWLLENKISFIYDASVDREWKNLRKKFQEAGYSWFVLGLDLNKRFLLQLYKAKDYLNSEKRIDQLIKEHKKFLAYHGSDVGLHITAKQFKDRLKLSARAVEKWLSNPAKITS